MKIGKNLNLIIVLTLAFGFFLLTSLTILTNQPEGGYYLWSSPDESANYYFSSNYAISGELSVLDRAGVISEGWTSPRSTRNDLGFLKPVSFPGILLIYGAIASFFGLAVIPFLTPLFASLGIIIFYCLIRRFFKERVALWSAFLLAFFPVYIYYSVRAMFHNVLFIVLLLAGLYLLSSVISRIKNKKNKGFIKEGISESEESIKISKKSKFKNFLRKIYLNLRRVLVAFNNKVIKFLSFNNDSNRWLSFASSFFAGIFIGLAIITRTSEILWLLPLLFLAWLFYARRFGLIRLLLFLTGLFLAWLPSAYYNQILYGSYFYGGYNELNSSIDEISQVGASLVSGFGFSYWQELLKKLETLIFYFGFKPLQSLEMFQAYIIKMFPFIFWPGAFTFIILMIKGFYRPKKKIILYLLGGLLISVFLIFYYGSWKFNDNPDLTRTTIGNSYTRYWLPIYLWLMPLAAWFLVRFSQVLFRSKKIAKNWRQNFALIVQIAFIFVYIISSLFFVFFGSEEGLTYWRYNKLKEKNTAEIVLNKTEKDAVIINRYNDKYFFPNRKVIMATFPDDDLTKITNRIIDFYPVYYFHFRLNEKDLNYLNERRLAPYNLKIEPIMMTGIDTYLYRLEKLEEPEFLDEEKEKISEERSN
ncbi:glycosyltransferase family 39 protein [Patescibacteria group bacterium]|nr:glycosyltransferase family 39 protein [Patescibacteria group bacterium]